MEATLLGIPAIAMSQYFKDPHRVKWSTAESHGPDVLRKLCDFGWPKNTLLNVNFPDVISQSVKSIEVTNQGRRKIGDELAKGFDPRGEEYFWIGALRTEETFKPGTDLYAVVNGSISVTPISLDFTDVDTLNKMQAKIS